MSRCFPFPPPGYEKKTRAEDLDLLKKEKHREKKHKKDRRDKEKKEGREKREKDRSDEKQRQKKEKKEKHRDKKKDKEKNRDKDKNNHVISDDKRLLGNAEADKGEKNFAKSKEREKEKSTVSSELMEYPTVYNGVVVGKNSHLASENKNCKHLHELGNKIAIEEGKKTNLLAEKYPYMEIKKDAVMPRMGVSTPATPMTTSERSKERKLSDGKMDRHGQGAERRPSESILAQKFTGMVQNRYEGVARQVEKNAERRVEVKEKIMGIEGDGRKGEKRKDEDREKSIEKYKERDKKIKVERTKDMCQEMLVEQSRNKDNNKVPTDLLRENDGNKKDLLLGQSAKPAKLMKEDNKAAAIAAPEIPKKRKEFGPNGVIHEGDVGPNKKARVMFSSLPMTENGRQPSQNATTVIAPVKQHALSNAKQDEGEVRPNKMAKVTSSTLPLTENGRSLQPSQDSTVFPPAKQQTLSNAKMDHKDCRINGTINPLQSASKASQATALATALADRDPGAVKKLPHPDTKYLAKILLVPKVEEWSEFDEQEWLFSSSHSQQNKPKAETSQVDDTTPQVWAEPLMIESADVFALPYVIPR